MTVNTDDVLVFGQGVSEEFLSSTERRSSMPTSSMQFAKPD